MHGLSPGDGATAIKHAWANVDPSVRNDYEETAASMQVEYDQKLKPYCSFSALDWCRQSPQTSHKSPEKEKEKCAMMLQEMFALHLRFRIPRFAI